MNSVIRTYQASPIDYTSYFGDARLEHRGNEIATKRGLTIFTQVFTGWQLQKICA